MLKLLLPLLKLAKFIPPVAPPPAASEASEPTLGIPPPGHRARVFPISCAAISTIPFRNPWKRPATPNPPAPPPLGPTPATVDAAAAAGTAAPPLVAPRGSSGCCFGAMAFCEGIRFTACTTRRWRGGGRGGTCGAPTRLRIVPRTRSRKRLLAGSCPDWPRDRPVGFPSWSHSKSDACRCKQGRRSKRRQEEGGRRQG